MSCFDPLEFDANSKSSESLLGASDAPVFEWVNPNSVGRLLLVADHAGYAVPIKLAGLGLDPVFMDQHIAYDIGAAAVTRQLAVILQVPAILAGYSRLVIDLNRSLDDPSSIPEQSDGVVIPGNHNLDVSARVQRAARLFYPYHQAISARLAQIRDRGIIPALISIHSYTPVMNGIMRPWEIGVLWKEDNRIAEPLIHRLRQEENRGRKLMIGDNEPYSAYSPAGYTMATHAESVGLPHVLIEIRQDLIKTSEGQTLWARWLSLVLRHVLADDGLYQIKKFG